jgi:pimeloyl-ACP methyl ester carboxylesterase
VLEAIGPGVLDFLPPVAGLSEHASARVATLDPAGRTIRVMTGPLLVHNLVASGGSLHVEHAVEEPPGGLARHRTRLPVAAAAVPRSLSQWPVPRVEAAERPGRRVPEVLWLHGPVPPSLTEAGIPAVALDPVLDWPADADSADLRSCILGPIRSALRDLPAPMLVGGHSFGATLALYALAHLPELPGAIVHSGCYNRTLTPHGFQQETRRYWDAAELYRSVSPFHFADKLDRPVLLAHGTDDLNPATPPDHAVAFYRAVVAAGGHARLVLLPGEGHTFRYRESLVALGAEHRQWVRRWGRA